MYISTHISLYIYIYIMYIYIRCPACGGMSDILSLLHEYDSVQSCSRYWMYLCIHIYIRTYVSICECIYTYILIFTCINAYILMYNSDISLLSNDCIHVYMYIFTCKFIQCICIYTWFNAQYHMTIHISVFACNYVIAFKILSLFLNESYMTFQWLSISRLRDD